MIHLAIAASDHMVGKFPVLPVLLLFAGGWCTYMALAYWLDSRKKR